MWSHLFSQCILCMIFKYSCITLALIKIIVWLIDCSVFYTVSTVSVLIHLTAVKLLRCLILISRRCWNVLDFIGAKNMILVYIIKGTHYCRTENRNFMHFFTPCPIKLSLMYTIHVQVLIEFTFNFYSLLIDWWDRVLRRIVNILAV